MVWKHPQLEGPVGSVWLNPERPETERKGHGAADALDKKAGGGGPMAGLAEHAD